MFEERKDLQDVCLSLLSWAAFLLWELVKIVWLPFLGVLCAYFLFETYKNYIVPWFVYLTSSFLIFGLPAFTATNFSPGPFKETNWLFFLIGLVGSLVGRKLGMYLAKKNKHAGVRFLVGKKAPS